MVIFTIATAFPCRFASTFRAMMLPIPEKSNENHPIDRVGTVSAT
jgi:hypothetical protein